MRERGKFWHNFFSSALLFLFILTRNYRSPAMMRWKWNWNYRWLLFLLANNILITNDISQNFLIPHEFPQLFSLHGSDNDDVRMRNEMEGNPDLNLNKCENERALGWINFLAGCSFFHSKTFCSIKYISEQLNSHLCSCSSSTTATLERKRA